MMRRAHLWLRLWGMTLLWLLLCMRPAFSELTREPRIEFEHIAPGEGRLRNSISSIVQDQLGFLWIGTSDGLFRYDGYQFTPYLHDPENPASISHNHITALHEDRNGVLWIGTNGGGLNAFYRETERFERYQAEPNASGSLSHHAVTSIYEDRSGTLWVGTNGGGLNVYQRDTGQFFRYVHHDNTPGSISSNFIQTIYETSAGELWIGTLGGGLNRFMRGTGEFLQYRHESDNPFSLSHNAVFAILEDRAGTLWVGTFGGGLNRFDRDTGQFAAYLPETGNLSSLSHQKISTLIEDQDGVLWIGTNGGGVNRFMPPQRQNDPARFFSCGTDSENPKSLGNTIITSLYADRGGVLWVGTEGGGLYKFTRQSETFPHYQTSCDRDNLPAYNVVLSLHEDRTGDLWVGTQGDGLIRFDRTSNECRQYRAAPDDPAQLGSDTITALLEDRRRNLWIGTRGGGLHRFERERERFTRYRHERDAPNSISSDNIRVLYEDTSGTIWIGTEHAGLDRFDPESRQFTHYWSRDNDSAGLNGNAIWAIFEDRQASLWIGTDGGLFRFDRHNGSFYCCRTNASGLNSLAVQHIRAIHEDRAGTLWIGTRGGGLQKFDRKHEEFHNMTQQAGLPSDVIYGILEDENGRLWLSTNIHGLIVFDPQSEIARQYDTGDGLQSQHFSSGASHQSRSGEMFFGGINGFNAFYPDQIGKHAPPPPIVFTDFRLAHAPVGIGGDSPLQQAISVTKSIQTSYRENTVTFEFAALDYTMPERNRYAYMLEGFEHAWVDADVRRRVTYTRVPPGQYVFRVKGTNHTGVWNEEGTALTLVVVPPFWATWWFKVLAAGLIMGTVLAGFFVRIRTIQHQKRLLEELVRERTAELVSAKQAAESANYAKSRFLSNMSHELRTPLNAILGFAQLMARTPHTDDDRENLTIIQQNGEYLLTLINQVLDLSKIESGHITLNESIFDLYRLLDDLHDMLSLQTQKKGLQLSFKRHETVPQFIRSDEVKLRQVLINLLNNAIKFTQEGHVELEVTQVTEAEEDDITSEIYHLTFTIEDSGPGIAPEELEMLFEPFTQTQTGRRAQEGTGLGLPISRKFVQLMGGDIRVKSLVDQGTTFSFEIQTGPVNGSPGRQEHAVRRAVAMVPEQRASDGSPYRFLIVDDNPDNRKLFVKLLQPFDFELREAVNGREALMLWEEWKPHLSWMDLRMPDMDGYEVIQRIRARAGGRHTVIIAVSASSLDDERGIAVSNGCDDFLRKPFRDVDVFRLIHSHLGVRFVYAERDEEAHASYTKAAPLKLCDLPSALPALPPDLLSQLEFAAKICDVDELKKVILSIRPHDPSLAETLIALVENFEFMPIMTAIKESRTASHSSSKCVL